MNDKPSSSPPESKPTELIVSAERHRFMCEILDYVRMIHRHIDPDMYDIDAKRLESNPVGFSAFPPSTPLPSPRMG